MKFNLFKKKETEKRNNEITYVKPYSSGALFFNYYDNGTAMGLSTVFAAVDMISNSMAELPIIIKSNKDDTNIISSHPIVKLFDSAQINKFLLIKQIFVDMLLYGNGYIYIRRDQTLKPIELVYLNTKSITINYT
jgi:HK97 family phage portal protein